MKKIYDLLDTLSNTSSTKEKLVILQECKEDADVKEYMRLVHDSGITLGVAEIPFFPSMGEEELSLEKLKELTNKLAERELTGKKAVEAIVNFSNDLNLESQYLLMRWIERSLDAGVSVSTINKVWEGMIRVQPYMRCSLPTDVDLNEWPWSKGVYIQTKEDGAWAECKTTHLCTRAGNLLKGECFDSIIDDAKNLGLPSNKELHGEVLVYVDGVVLPREKNNGRVNSLTQGSSLKSNERIEFVVWDLVTTGKVDKTPYEKRFQELLSLVKENSTIRVVEYAEVYSLNEALDFYRKQLSLKREGAVIKRKDGVWKSGNSKDQIKLKIVAELDLKIVGYKEGNGKYSSTFGSIELESSCGKLAVSVSGIKDKDRKHIHLHRDSLLGKVVTIKANGIQYGDKIHSLFLPRFVEIRNDKDVADDFGRIEKIFESIMFSSSE